MWKQWERHGILPRPGGWLDQPLRLLILIEAISLTVATYSYKNAKESDWSKFTETQMGLIQWIEND